MIDRHTTRVFGDYRIGGTGYRLVNSQAGDDALGDGRLPGAESPLQGEDIPGAQIRGNSAPQGYGRLLVRADFALQLSTPRLSRSAI